MDCGNNFKDVVGFEGSFMVSDSGEIYSKRTGKILKQSISNGYAGISTKIGGRNSKAIRIRTHRAVAEAFIPMDGGRPYVNHIDGNKLNNSASNLEWCSASENSIHAHRNALAVSKKGDLANGAKLSCDQVISIRKRYKARCRINGARAIAKELGVCHTTVIKAVRKISWSSV